MAAAIAIAESLLRKRDYASVFLLDQDNEEFSYPLCKRTRRRSPPPDRQLLEGVLSGCLEFKVGLSDTQLEPEHDEQLLNSAASQSLTGAGAIASLPTKVNEANHTENTAAENACAGDLPSDGPGWVNLLVNEMTCASDLNDAKLRASNVLGLLEKWIVVNAGTETSMENKLLKDRFEALLHDNGILKRAVLIQHERQKDYEKKRQEMQLLKKLLSEYQEKMKQLEITNYALMVHLKQLQHNTLISGRFNPDVF